jgi:hypothetical protein
LSLVSREGSGGLLPPTERAPLALMVDTDLIASASWLRRQLLSVRAGASVAMRSRGKRPLLDFPFLYQRFAALYAPVVPRVALVASGRVGPHLGYELELRHYWLPVDDLPLAQATEYAAALQLFIADDHRIELGGRISSARLPVGRRSHVLPHVDYRIAF